MSHEQMDPNATVHMPENDSYNTPLPAIIGGAVGAVALVIVLTVVAVVFIRRRTGQKGKLEGNFILRS